MPSESEMCTRGFALGICHELSARDAEDDRSQISPRRRLRLSSWQVVVYSGVDQAARECGQFEGT